MEQRQVVLIVDDTPDNLQVLGRMLEREGYQVLVATTGVLALEIALAPSPPDLILLDIMMPGMDGYEVCRHLKEDPRTVGIPVLFVSGLDETIDKVTAFRAGGVDYIVKPFPAEEVLARVRTHLDLCRQRRELRMANAKLSRALAAEELLNHQLIAINEKLRSSEQLKSQFLATMRRELDNPLEVIRVLAGQIVANESEAAPLATELQLAAYALDFQLRNIFAAADLEAGVAQPLPQPVAVRPLLAEILREFAGPARARGVELHVQGEDAEINFSTDQGMIRQIIANLLANAIRFSPIGGRVLLDYGEDGEFLTLTVGDQGPGIPEEQRAALFAHFQLVSSPSSAPGKGHGLGLAVVKAFLDLLGGDIRIDSGAAGGTRCTVRLPRLTLPPDDGLLFPVDCVVK